MRYYDIKINGTSKYTSHPNGQFDPGALRVELNIPIKSADTINLTAFARIWGIPWTDMQNAKQLFMQPIEIWGGMKQGLPLANPAQSGKLCSGIIAQAFGNWEGTNKTLDISITNSSGNTSSGTATPVEPTTGRVAGPNLYLQRHLRDFSGSSILARSGNWRRQHIGPSPRDIGSVISSAASGLNSFFQVGQNQTNIVLNWPKGQKLSDALQSCLSTAFPQAKITIDISPNLVQQHDEHGYYQTLGQLSTYIRQISSFIMQGTKANYSGVAITFNNNEISVADSEASSKTFTQSSSTINYQDLVGLPHWVDAQYLQVKTVMRADIKFNQIITIAPTPTFASFINGGKPAAGAGDIDNRGQMAYSGLGRVYGINHYGDSRSSSGDAWVSVFNVFVGSATNPVNWGDQSGTN
jgi:hypothetical protein